jgi:hypothetical protein
VRELVRRISFVGSIVGAIVAVGRDRRALGPTTWEIESCESWQWCEPMMDEE